MKNKSRSEHCIENIVISGYCEIPLSAVTWQHASTWQKIEYREYREFATIVIGNPDTFPGMYHTGGENAS